MKRTVSVKRNGAFLRGRYVSRNVPTTNFDELVVAVVTEIAHEAAAEEAQEVGAGVTRWVAVGRQQRRGGVGEFVHQIVAVDMVRSEDGAPR